MAVTVEPAEDLDAVHRVTRAHRLATLLDESVRLPVVNYRVGVDAIAGLVPVVGDLLAAAASLFIVFEAYRLGARRTTLARMLLNVGVDAAVGSVPVVGDLFDAAWKANVRNADLLERDVLGR